MVFNSKAIRDEDAEKVAKEDIKVGDGGNPCAQYLNVTILGSRGNALVSVFKDLV